MAQPAIEGVNMANGDCAVGSANKAEIANLKEEVRDMRHDVDELKFRRARLDGVSMIVVGLVTALATIAGAWLSAHMQ